MINKLSNFKKHFNELANIVNSFKSEAAQLRIIDYILTHIENDIVEEKPLSGKPLLKNKIKTKTTKKQSRKDKSKSNKRKSKARIGPYKMIDVLIEEGFFKNKQTMNDIIVYCDKHKATKLKTTDFSSKLSRLVRDGTLNREKNSDKQYEYWKK